MNFEYRSFSNKTYFGEGKIKLLPELVQAFPKVMAIAEHRASSIVENLEETLGKNRVIRFSKVIQHVPQHLVDEAQAVVQQETPDTYIAIGGGSAIGLAKALVLTVPKPIIAVPTTYAGSEQTNIFGISSELGKKTGRDDKVLPQIVIYDPSLTITMPKPLAVTSAMNAMAHLMEALYSPTRNPITSNLAKQGILAIKKGLQLLANSDALTPKANEAIQFGAYLAGKCLCEVAMALHHKAAHVLGGSFGMEHSKVHTVLQAYVLAYQWPYLAQDIQKDFRDAFDSEHPPQILKVLASDAGAPTDLQTIGFKQEDIEKAAAIMVANPYANVAPLTQEGLAGMLRNAYEGRLVMNG